MSEPNNQFTTDSDQQFDSADIEKNKAMGGLAYILFFLPLITCPESKYGRFHANQGLLLLILSFIAGIIVRLLFYVFYSFFSLLLWRIYGLLATLIWLAVAVLAVIGLINGFTGKTKPLPVIGKITIIK